MAQWVWVVGPQCYLDGDGGEDAKLRPGSAPDRWRCDRATAVGDDVVLYRSRAARDLSHLLRVTGPAEPDGDVWTCEARVVRRFPHPVALSELRADPVTASWPALRASFVRAAWPVADDVWERVLALAGVRP